MYHRRQGRPIVLNPFRGFFEVGKTILQVVIMRHEDVVILKSVSRPIAAVAKSASYEMMSQRRSTNVVQEDEEKQALCPMHASMGKHALGAKELEGNLANVSSGQRLS